MRQALPLHRLQTVFVDFLPEETHNNYKHETSQNQFRLQTGNISLTAGNAKRQ